jgi:protein-tyrosine kinase
VGKIYDALKKSAVLKDDGVAPPATVPVMDKGRSAETAHDAPGKEMSCEPKTQELAHDRLEPSMVTLLNPQSFESEQFKLLRSRLFFPQQGSPPRCIMVTSTTLGEGKSFVASNLAVTIAQSINEHVLLMDCDLRRPTINEKFGFGTVRGLSDYLTNGSALPGLLLKTSIPKLTILPAGKPPANPSELLSSEKMSTLLFEVKTRYSDRYIVVDAPPPRLTAEANAIARQVDGILVVIQSRGANRESIEDLVEMLGREKVLGVIFNRYDVRSRRYGYRSGYGKYSGYQPHSEAIR